MIPKGWYGNSDGGAGEAKVCICDGTSMGVNSGQAAKYLQPRLGGHSKSTLSSETSLESLEFLLLLFVPNMFARFRKIAERPSAAAPAGREAVRNPPAKASHERTHEEEEAFGLKLVEDGVDPTIE
jgi:hypothetical protein